MIRQASLRISGELGKTKTITITIVWLSSFNHVGITNHAGVGNMSCEMPSWVMLSWGMWDAVGKCRLHGTKGSHWEGSFEWCKE